MEKICAMAGHCFSSYRTNNFVWYGAVYFSIFMPVVNFWAAYWSMYFYVYSGHSCIPFYVFWVSCIMGLLSGQVISIPLYLFKFLLKPYLQYLCWPYIQIEMDIRINFSSHWTNICDFTVYWVALLTSVIAMSSLALFFLSSSISFFILLRSFFCFLNFSHNCFFSLSLLLALLSIIFPYCLWYNTNFWLLSFQHTILSLLFIAIFNYFLYSLLNKWNLHYTF